MAGLIDPPWRELCRVEAIPDRGSRGFSPRPGGCHGLFAIRHGGAVVVYVNACPHLGVPLDWVPDHFLSVAGDRIVCATHGAEFRIDNGECLHGPCYGDRLDSVMIQIKDGIVWVSQDAVP